MKIFNPLQELDTSPDSEFVKAVDFVVQDIIPDRYILESVPLGVTPLVFQLCEIEPVKMRTTYGAIEKVISEFINRPNDKGRYQRIHNINPEDLKKLPVLLCDPIAVIQSQTVGKDPNSTAKKDKNKSNGYVIVIELIEKKKFKGQDHLSPAIAAVHLNFNKRTKEWDLNITSTHGRNHWFFVENISSNLLMYLNREKCRTLVQKHIAPNIRQPLRNREDKEKLEIVAELCGLEYNKGHFLDTRKTTMEARCYSKENDLLFEKDNTPKPTLMQAIKEKISPKQPKRSIPTPTGYKTEEDLRQFYQEIKQKPLTKEQAQLVGKDMISQVEPMNHTDFIEVFNNHIEKVYNNNGDTNIQSIHNCVQQMVKKVIPDILKAQQTQEHTQPEKKQSKDKGGLER